MAINAGMVQGNVSSDIQVHQGNTMSASFNVACERSYVDKNTGKRPVDFVPAVAFSKLAEVAQKWLAKGLPVALTGSWQQRQYESNTFVYAPGHAKAGQKAMLTDWAFVIDHISLIGSSKKQNQNGGAQMNQQAPAAQQSAPQTQAPAQNYDQASNLSANDLPF